MKRVLSIAFSLCLSQPLLALDRAGTVMPPAGLLLAAAVDTPVLQDAHPEQEAGPGLSLDADLADREGRRWNLQWKLLGDGSELSRAAGRQAWRAGVVLTSPDGQVLERVFARGAGLVGRLADASDDWEWRSQGAVLLPAKLRFDVDGREVILLLEAIENPALDEAQMASRVRVRGFINQGLDKTYLSGRGQLQRDWQRLADRARIHPRRNPATHSIAAE